MPVLRPVELSSPAAIFTDEKIGVVEKAGIR
jgi:hypothetical protein